MMGTKFIKCVSLLKKCSPIKRNNLNFRRSFCTKGNDGFTKTTGQKGTSAEETEGFVELPYPSPKCTEFEQPRNAREVMNQQIEDAKYVLKNRTLRLPGRKFLPKHFEVVIIGSGPVGASIANFLKVKLGEQCTILVIDPDLSENKYNRYAEDHIVAPQLSVGHLTQQFTLKENIKLAQFSANFLRNMHREMGMFFEDVKPITFRPFGQLTLATEKGYETMKESHIIQGNFNVPTELATPYQLSQRFPWLNVKDIALGCLGEYNEGWFDPWEYSLSIKSLAMRRGVMFKEAVPLEFHFKDITTVWLTTAYGVPEGMYQPCYAVVIQDADGLIQKIEFARVIFACGSETGRMMNDMFALGDDNIGIYKLRVPIGRKKHYVFYFEAEDTAPGFASPMVMDPTGVYFRREAFTNNYICGCSLPFDDPNADNLKVDDKIFTEHVWPILAHRVPIFEKLRLKSGWAYFEDNNNFDESPILSFYPGFPHSVIICAGFGSHTYCYAPAIGLSAAELCMYTDFQSIDLHRFNFNRIVQEVPLVENIIL